MRPILSTRREVLKVGAGVAGAVALSAIVPRSLRAQCAWRRDSAARIDDPRIKALLLRGLDAATSAGATYAEARVTRTVHRSVTYEIVDGEELHVGIRALVNGYWGFASGPLVTPEELVRLGRSAAYQAQTNALGKGREIDLAPVPTVPNGHWVMPVKIDPFSVHPLAIQDHLGGLGGQIYTSAELGRDEELHLDLKMECVAQERALATTQGTYVTQCVYRTSGTVDMELRNDKGREERRSVDLLLPAGVGWELFQDQPVRDTAVQLIFDARADLALPVKPVDVGRFEVVMDAKSVAGLVSQSIGAASELDRALGYEANAGGTSYLRDPVTMLDTFAVGSPLLTVTANRSEPGGAATVQWDDEGVSPIPFTVVKNGVFQNYHYTREGAGWLRAAKVQRPFQSLGVACAPSAVDAPLPHTANLAIAPGPGTDDFRSLTAAMEKGIALRGLMPSMDFQRGSGILLGQMYEIKRGRRVARLLSGSVLFKTTQLWKSLVALGGAKSAQRFGLVATKGEPEQSSYHSVTAVPAAFKEVTVVDFERRG